VERITGQQKYITWAVIAATAIGLTVIAVRIIRSGSLRTLLRPVSLAGAVLREDSDPRKQTPLADVHVTAFDGSILAEGRSDSAGLFAMSIRQRVYTSRLITLKFEHPGYETFETTVKTPADRLYIIRMQPLVREPVQTGDNATTAAKITRIKDVRVRYLFKDQTTISVGTLAKQFESPNTGDVPCRNRRPCSPDGKWRAAQNSLSLDAEEGNQFQNIRVSCIAGPCPFTRVEPDDLSRPARKIKITVLNWSDTASFLVEADVTRTMATDKIRYSYPFIVGQSMDFSLPSASEGLSIEANVDGEAIVFPLGPDLILPWATCSVETPATSNKIYRCQLKSGYEFQQ
jgi:hypothetical protein